MTNDRTATSDDVRAYDSLPGVTQNAFFLIAGDAEGRYPLAGADDYRLVSDAQGDRGGHEAAARHYLALTWYEQHHDI